MVPRFDEKISTCSVFFFSFSVLVHPVAHPFWVRGELTFLLAFGLVLVIFVPLESAGHPCLFFLLLFPGLPSFSGLLLFSLSMASLCSRSIVRHRVSFFLQFPPFGGLFRSSSTRLLAPTVIDSYTFSLFEHRPCFSSAFLVFTGLNLRPFLLLFSAF